MITEGYVTKHFKKVIGGKRYDNKTAKYISSTCQQDGSFSDYFEDLYLKKTGEYFLVGYGNAASKYAAPYPGGGSQSGEKIIPLSIEEAKNWIEKHNNDLYEELFLIDDENQKAFSFLMDETLYYKIKSISDYYSTSMKDFVIQALEKYVDRYDLDEILRYYDNSDYYDD